MPIDLTLYERLEVSPNESEHDIKKAGRKMALRWHPDKNLDCQEEATMKFKEIQEAVDILTDPQRRHHYDQFGFANTNMTNNAPSNQFPSQFPFPFPQFPFPFGMGGMPGMGMPGMGMPGMPGMMGGMPGGIRIPGGTRMNGVHNMHNMHNNMHNIHNIHNEHVHQSVSIPTPIPEKITFSYQRYITCQNCICTHCSGKGMKLIIQQMGMVTIQNHSPCLECNVKGHNGNNGKECIRCNQTRRISTEHTMTMNIPNIPNIGSNQNIQLCIPNEGHQLCSGNTNLIIDMKFV
jgi:DnaJ-class molecular chaperone